MTKYWAVVDGFLGTRAARGSCNLLEESTNPCIHTMSCYGTDIDDLSEYAEFKNAELRCVLNRLLKTNQAYLTVAQLAHHLQVSVSTIYGWVDRDYIPFLMAGDLVRFDPTAIHNWMLSEADRKREKKRRLKAMRDKVAPAPGGCNRKGAIG